MRVVFMGTPAFAVPTLEALVSAGYDIPLVVTKPDAQRDRGKKIKEPPVKERAQALGISVAQPERISGQGDFYEQLRDCDPDAIVVVAYGMLLPGAIIDLPRWGCLNVHGSLLPQFRGAAPIQRAILSGQETTGVTIMEMDRGMDTGPMLAFGKRDIGRKNNQELHDELSQLGAQLLIETLGKLENQGVKKIVQRQEEATYAPRIDKKEGALNFSQSGHLVARQVQAFSPRPGAYTHYRGTRWKILRGRGLPTAYSMVPGTIVKVETDQLIVAAKESSFAIEEIQLPGKKAMRVADYLRGNRIEKNSVLG